MKSELIVRRRAEILIMFREVGRGGWARGEAGTALFESSLNATVGYRWDTLLLGTEKVHICG